MADTDKPQISPGKQLVLHVMLSLLVSVAVFVVVSWMIIVPQLARQEVRIRELESQVGQMQAEAEEADAAAEAAAAAAAKPPPAGAAPAAPAPAPSAAVPAVAK